MKAKSESEAKQELKQWKVVFPEAEPAYKSSGRTTFVALAAMLVGAPFAGIGSLLVGAIVALVAALVISLIVGMGVTLINFIPGVQLKVPDDISPIVVIISTAVSVLTGVATCGALMGKCTAALGRVGRNRSESAVESIAFVATTLLVFYAVWRPNMQTNPMMPEILRGWFGLVVGVLLAAIGGRAAMLSGAESVMRSYFCEKCNLFIEPKEWRVTRASAFAIRDVLSAPRDCDLELTRSDSDKAGNIRLCACPKCGHGYIDVAIHFEATWGDGGPQESISSNWLTASKAIESHEARALADALSDAKECNVEATDGRIPCGYCGAMVLPSTASNTNGLCMPCHKRGVRPPN